MKELIRRVLREESNSMLDFINNAPSITYSTNIDGSKIRPEIEDIDDFMWYLIDYVDYPSDFNHKRINQFIITLFRYGLLDDKLKSLMRRWVSRKQSKLYNLWDDEKLTHVSGDDSFGDWLAHVVSLGKELYEKALKKDISLKEFFVNLNPKESFNYAIPFKDEYD
jgi:hypothetical protein